MGTLTTPVQKIMFELCDVELAKSTLDEMPYRQAIVKHLNGPLEGFSKGVPALVATRSHAFVAAVHVAFNDHRPLILSPDHIWLLIAQGFATHVRANAENLRSQFVTHEGKERLKVIRPDMRKGQPDAPWDEVVAEFGSMIRDRTIGDIHDLLTPQFSTTTPVEKTAFEMVLMDTLQEYFEYMVSWCGIPSIILEGSPDDWRKLQEHTRKLGMYQLDWWTKLLDPILSELVQTAEGNINKDFWGDFYKYQNHSGGPSITGWIVKFFPYTENHDEFGRDQKRIYEVNPYLDYPSSQQFKGFTSDMVTSGLSYAPFKWEQGIITYEMGFAAGFVGIRQDKKSKALRPEIGWAVQDVEAVNAYRKTPPL